jgi:serine protease AprX
MENSKRFCFLVLMISSTYVFAQGNRYMVFFKDKAGTTFTSSQPLSYLSQKAVDRRIKEDVAITPQDFPVNQNYVDGIKSTGAEVFFTTRWMNGVLVQCEASLVNTLQGLAYVDHVEYVAPGKKLLAGGRRTPHSQRKNNVGERTVTQLGMLGIPQMHADGFKGEGITIAVFDGGFPGVSSATPFQHIFSEGRFNESASYDFVRNTTNVFQYDDHGTNVFSVIAAEIPDAYTGGAYEANFQLYVTEDDGPEHRIEEYNWLFAAERADSAGVDIVNSSLGYYDFDDASMNYSVDQMDGNTTVVTRAAQWLADRGVVVVTSAGNEGSIAWKKITAPADAVDVIAVANVNMNGNRSGSSSIGPSADGRIKPDLAALGSSVSIITPGGVITTASGTSVAAPLITSLVAGVWQRYPELTSKQMIEILKLTASRSSNPDTLIGYGIPNYSAIVNRLERASQTNLFEVYPNPVTDTLIISPLDPDSVQSCHVQLISSSGQLMSEQQISFSWLNNIYKTDISSLPAGIYFVRVLFENRKYTFKVVKK